MEEELRIPAASVVDDELMVEVVAGSYSYYSHNSLSAAADALQPHLIRVD